VFLCFYDLTFLNATIAITIIIVSIIVILPFVLKLLYIPSFLSLLLHLLQLETFIAMTWRKTTRRYQIWPKLKRFGTHLGEKGETEDEKDGGSKEGRKANEGGRKGGWENVKEGSKEGK
jgi:hypothetical protein